MNTLGIRRIMFAVDDIEAVLARLQATAGELVFDVVRGEDEHQLCYVPGPRASSTH